MTDERGTTVDNLLNEKPETLDEWKAYAIGLADTKSRHLGEIHNLNRALGNTEVALHATELKLEDAVYTGTYHRALSAELTAEMKAAYRQNAHLRDDLKRANDEVVFLGCVCLVLFVGLVATLIALWS